MDEFLLNYIIDYIPFEKCNTCQKSINILHKNNYYFMVNHFIYCSEICYNHI